MKVRYKPSPMWIGLGILWIALALFLFVRVMPEIEEQYYVRQLLTMVALPLILSFYFFMMPRINYLTIKEDLIVVHKSVIIFKLKLNRSELLFCRVIDKDLIFYDTKDKMLTIHLDWCHKDDAIKALEHIQTFTKIFEGYSSEPLNISEIKCLK